MKAILIVSTTYILIAIVSALLYIPKFRQIAGAKIKSPRYKASCKRRIGIVIPARDESQTIGELIQSIKAQDYSKENFKVFVIVKDSTDKTIELVKEIGASVFICPDQTCKGDALHYFFENVDKTNYESIDAFVLVDADAVLAKDYLTELNNAFESNADIIVTKKLIKNYLGKQFQSVICNCSALIYPINDELGNLYRQTKNIPLNMCGQGLAFRRSVIDRKGGWHYRTITEDYQLKMDSLLEGFKSEYCPYACIYTEEVLTASESYKRRLRWLTGVWQNTKLYSKKVKQKLKNDKSLKSCKFDYLYYSYAIILFAVDTVLTVICGLSLAVYFAIQSQFAWVFALLLLTLLPIFLLYVILLVFGIIAMVNYKEAFACLTAKDKFKTVLFMPIFLLQFVPIYIKGKLNSTKSNVWEKTKRFL